MLIDGGATIQETFLSSRRDAWAHDAIKQVGNYGEIWDHTVAPLGIDRGPSKLVSDGGLTFTPPIR